MWLVYKLSGNPFILDWLVSLRYYLLHYNFLPAHSLIDGQLKHPRHHTSFAMHSYINHSYYTLLRPINSPTTTHHHAHRSLYRTIRLSCTVKSFTTSCTIIKGNSLFSFAYQGIDLICTTLSGILVALFGAITLYVIDSFTFAITALLFFSLKMPQQTAANTSLSTKQYFSDLKKAFQSSFVP